MTMRPRKQKDLRFAVDLTNFYYHTEPEERLALRLIHHNLEMTAIAALWLCTHVFTRDGFELKYLHETIDTSAYEIFYDEFKDEYELDTGDVELAIRAIVGMGLDMYPVVMAYASHLLDNGKSYEWVIESIHAAEWQVPNNEDEQDDEYEEVHVIAPVLEYHHFTN